jgi:hypothetical protein
MWRSPPRERHERSPELLHVEALVAQPGAQLLVVAVPPGLAGFDVKAGSGDPREPRGEFAGDELRHVLATLVE